MQPAGHCSLVPYGLTLKSLPILVVVGTVFHLFCIDGDAQLLYRTEHAAIVLILSQKNCLWFFCCSSVMASTNHVVYAVLKFLDEQQRSPDLTPDAIESLEGWHIIICLVLFFCICGLD